MTQALRHAPPLLLMVAVVASLLLFSTNTASSLSEKHGWRLVGCMMGPVQ